MKFSNSFLPLISFVISYTALNAQEEIAQIPNVIVNGQNEMFE